LLSTKAQIHFKPLEPSVRVFYIVHGPSVC